MLRKCKTGWVEEYLEYTHNQESPTAFHEWTAIAMISSAIGRNVWIPRIKYTIFPNLYIILVAASAKCRKTVAVNIGLRILKAIENPPLIFAQKITPEALIQALEGAKVDGASSGLIFSSELSVFLGADAIRSGVIPALTDLYDSPKEWIYHTRGRGKEVLTNVTLSMLAATTKSDVKEILPQAAVGGGFTSRVIFVYQDKPQRETLFNVEDADGNELEETTKELELKSNLIYDLGTIRHTIKGKLKFSKEAKVKSLEWYRAEQSKVRDDAIDGYYARKHDTMFKVAAVLSISEGDNQIIAKKHIIRSLDMLGENEKNLGAIITAVMATSAGTETDKVLSIVGSFEQGILHSDLLRKCWRFASSADVSIMLRTLIESKEIEEEIEGVKRLYRIKKRW